MTADEVKFVTAHEVININSFDELRREIYNGIAGTQYVGEFCPSNQTLMSQGKAPVAPQSLQTGDNYNQIKYNIHHIKPVEDGGDVYNLDNLIIVAPKTHDEIHAEIDAQNREQKAEQTCNKE